MAVAHRWRRTVNPLLTCLLCQAWGWWTSSRSLGSKHHAWGVSSSSMPSALHFWARTGPSILFERLPECLIYGVETPFYNIEHSFPPQHSVSRKYVVLLTIWRKCIVLLQFWSHRPLTLWLWSTILPFLTGSFFHYSHAIAIHHYSLGLQLSHPCWPHTWPWS